jgi:hypothetical protein
VRAEEVGHDHVWAKNLLCQQNYSQAIEMHQSQTVQSAVRFERPAQQPRMKREPRSILCHTCQYISLVESTFKKSENIAIAHFDESSYSASLVPRPHPRGGKRVW